MKSGVQLGEFRLKRYPRDFAKVRAFYEDILQLQITKEWRYSPGNYGVMFAAGSAILELLSLEYEYAAPAGCDLSLEVSDVQKLWRDLREQSFVTKSLTHNSWGDTSFEIADPEDFRITFFTKG